MICPDEPKLSRGNVHWIKLKTGGVTTLLFTLIFSYYYFIKFKCSRCISFNNFNFIFPSKGKVTYFHNLLILTSSSIRFVLIRFILKFFNQRESFYVFQTSYVASSFKSVMSSNSNYKVCWPGVSFIGVEFVSGLQSEYKGKTLVVPISDVRVPHKNFSLILDIAEKIKSLTLIVPCDRPILSRGIPDNILFVGVKNRDEFLQLIFNSNGVLISSIYETLCLPIFESICLGKQSFVFEQPYLNAIINDIGSIDNIHSFTSVSQLKEKLMSDCTVVSSKTKKIISTANWEF